MNTKKTRSRLCLFLAVFMLFLSACGKDDGKSSQGAAVMMFCCPSV